jgi:hypothetical protein
VESIQTPSVSPVESWSRSMQPGSRAFFSKQLWPWDNPHSRLKGASAPSSALSKLFALSMHQPGVRELCTELV